MSPPPGREMEVSIEPDQRAAFLGLGQRHPLVVVDAEREMNDQVEPAVLRIEAADVHPERPLPAQRPPPQVDHLAGRDRSRRFRGNKGSAHPLTKSLGSSQDCPDPLG